MERLEIALGEFVAAMEAEGLTPGQQLAIYDQVARLIQVAHTEAWDSAIRAAVQFARGQIKP